MGRIRSMSFAFLLALPLVVAAGPASDATAAPTGYEHDVLRICEAVFQLFEQRGDEIWPGYSLAERPFVVYIPERWALFFNADRDVDGFGPLPDDWPDVGRDILYHEGTYGNLVGQLGFDYELGGITTVAIGFPESLPESMEDAELKMLGYIVHEAFHQYQNEFFGDTPWAREQSYPIEDRENAASAYLEMVLLVDALEAARDGEPERCRRSTARFLAVRDDRWRTADPFVAVYEQGKETREGTARFVELMSFHLMRDLSYRSALDHAPSPLRACFDSASMPGYLISCFGERMGDGCVPIEHLFRNRIYPVGSAQAFLLDYFGIEWRTDAEQRTPEFTYAQLLRDGLGVDDARFATLLEEARSAYDYPAMLAAAEREIERYVAEYREAVQAFDSQPGRRIEITLSSNGVYRSRVSTARKWVVDRGTRSICSHYQVYTLESDDLFLQVHEAGLFEENDWDAYRKKVAFYEPGVVSITSDGETVDLPENAPLSFGSIELIGAGFELRYGKPGTIIAAGDRLTVFIVPAGE
jgi:hypothetical protein